MLTIGSIVWGARDPQRAAEFWMAALDYRLLREPSDDWVMIAPRSGEGQQIAIMQVDAEASDRRRHHLDLYADDQSAEVSRLIDLGATEVPEWRYESDSDYVVLDDPDGNRFCVVQK